MLKVTIRICDGLDITKDLALGATIGELKALLAGDDPTGQTCAQDFILTAAQNVPNGSRPAVLADDVSLTEELSELAVVVPGEAGAGREEIALLTNVVEYRIMQRCLIKKLGEDPAKEGGIVKITRKVGSTIFTTGRTWTGPRGGEWVELDSLVEKPGWLLIEGPGFGAPGPLLQRIEPSEEPRMVLRVEKPTLWGGRDEDAVEYRHFVLPASAKVQDAKDWIALLFGLEPSRVVIGRPFQNTELPATRTTAYRSVRSGAVRNVIEPSPEDIAGNPALIQVHAFPTNPSDSMQQLGFKDGDDVSFVYTGDLAKGGEGKAPTWRGRGAPRARAEPIVPSIPSELRVHFRALGLEETTLPDDIKRHYRRLALECHPDKNPNDAEVATKRFQQIKAAYEAIREKLNL